MCRYIPPLSAGCTSLPSSKEAIAAELTKQESLLNQIHTEMNHGYTVRSDQLWEVQRFITLLKVCHAHVLKIKISVIPQVVKIYNFFIFLLTAL